MSGSRKLNIGKARRRVRMRSALLLTLGVCAAAVLMRLIMALGGAAFAGGFGVAMEAAAALLTFGGGAYLGLFVLDGDQSRIIPRGTLSRAQTLWLVLCGVLLTAPVTLLSDVSGALFGAGTAKAAFQAAAPGVFLLRALKSAVLVPVLEEIFFRGYLEGALERYGRARAAAVSALCFAAVHGGGGFLLYVGLGLLFSALLAKTGSLFAPMLMHGCYNFTLVLISCAGFSGLFAGLSFVSCALRLAMCAGLVYCLRRAFLSRGVRAKAQGMEPISRKETALLLAALAAMIAAAMTTA